MAYQFDLSSGQQLYLEQQGTQTIVTLSSSQAGQQQQASSSLQTGTWIAPPQAFRTTSGVVVKLYTNREERLIQVQGNQISFVAPAAIETAQPIPMQQVDDLPMAPMQPMTPMQPMQPMTPMQPMQPMQMGNMSMNLNPMEMRMGDMEMRIGSSPTASRHCSQCGTTVKPNDRFCSHCGKRLE